jgi:hypothetical protein
LFHGCGILIKLKLAFCKEPFIITIEYIRGYMKKLIPLFLVVSFVVINCATYEKGRGINLEPGQKPGVNLVFWKLDWQQVEGELIAVRGDSLLIKESESGTDVSVDIKDIRTITIKKKSKALLGAGIGLLVGAGLGWAIATAFEGSIGEEAVGNVIGVALVPIGLIGGALISARAGKGKTIQIEGKSDSEIKEIFEELRKKARVPDFQ